jgi:hypothetical protein
MGISLNDENDTEDDAANEISSLTTLDLGDTEDDGLSGSKVLADSKSKRKDKVAKKAMGKCDSGGPKEVDLAVFVDHLLIRKWTTKYPTNGNAQLKAFILNILSNVFNNS